LKKSAKNTKQKDALPPVEKKMIEADNKVQSIVNPAPTIALIYITGESPMVEQYAEICAMHGFNVCISWNEPPEQKPEFKSDNIKISNTIPADTSVTMELTNIDQFQKRKNLEKIDKALPDTAPILSSSITVTATEQSLWILHRHRLVGVSALPTFIEKPLVEVALTIYSPRETLEVVSRFFTAIGKKIEIVQDRIGMVLPRILCQVINEAAFAITEDIATPQDIDTALRLGVYFPLGPIELAKKIGFKQVYAVLDSIHTDLQEERYRVAPLLKQIAITNK